ETYAGATSSLHKQLQALAGSVARKQLKVGTLEGLSPVAAGFCRALFEDPSIERIELDVHDLHVLEARFAKGGFDLIFVPRPPGRRKPRFARLLGYQVLEQVSHPSSRTLVMSPFEESSHRDSAGRAVPEAGKGTRTLISNSLAIRRQWLAAGLG